MFPLVASQETLGFLKQFRDRDVIDRLILLEACFESNIVALEQH